MGPEETSVLMKIRQLRCFQRVNWSPDARELRRFAVAMLVGLVVIGLARAVRHHGLGTGTFVLWGIGVALALGALLPGLGRATYLMVYVPTSLIGFVLSHAILTCIFYLVFVPLGMTLRLLGKDPLGLRLVRGRSMWTRREGGVVSSRYYRQF